MKTKKSKTSTSSLSKATLFSLYQAVVSLFELNKSDLAGPLKLIDDALKDKKSDVVESTLSSLSFSFRKVDKNLSIKVAEKLTERLPNSSAAWLHLAYTFDFFKDYKSALRVSIKGLQFKPTPELLVKFGTLLSKFNQDKEALECVRNGYHLSANAIRLGSAALRVALKNADWKLSEEITQQFTEHYQHKDFESVETPRTHLLWCADESLNINVLSKFAHANFPARVSNYTYPIQDVSKHKLRIGFISYDYREHATSHLALGLLRHVNNDRFEYYAYCTSWDDSSALRRDILNRFTKVKMISNKSDKEAADIINADRIDILVDFNGLTEGTKMGVLSFKPAPIQISYLGFPGTSGGRYIDYIFADDYTLPSDRNALYPEKIIRIPPTYQMNDYDAKWLPPKALMSKTNLPNDKIVIGMFNNMNKITSVTWSAWMSILHGISNSVLWILEPSESAKANLLQAAKLHGISAEKIIFAPKLKIEEHFARLQLCDFVLDPWPYGGHTTTADALFCNVPVIALEGNNFASRVSGGLLIAAGLKQLIAKDIDDYMQLAIALAKDKDKLFSIKTHLSSNRRALPIFNAKHRTQQIERAFIFVYNRYIEKQTPVPFRVV
jgi:predicted O-linked N-acetylglucosamine transferase (SPINDLY family)